MVSSSNRLEDLHKVRAKKKEKMASPAKLGGKTRWLGLEFKFVSCVVIKIIFPYSQLQTQISSNII